MSETPEELVPYVAAVERDFDIEVALAAPLGSHEDLNLRVRDTRGRDWVVKCAARGTDVRVWEGRLAAVERLHDAGHVRVPAVLRSRQGGLSVLADVDGGRRLSVLEFMPGRIATSDPRPPVGFAAALGVAVAGMTRALASVDGATLFGGGAWDLREAPAVVNAASAVLAEPERGAVEAAVRAAWHRVLPVAGALSVQAIHGDLTADNCVLDDEDAIAGVIDFGDVGMGWRVTELAVAMASLLHHDGDAVLLALDAARACDALSPLDEAEVQALWPLVVARAAVLVGSAAVVAAHDPSNAYSLARRPLERRILERALSMGLDEAELLVRHALGRVPSLAEPRWVPMVEGAASAVVVHLGVEARVHDSGRFADPDAALAALVAAASSSGGIAVTAYGEPRLLPEALDARPARSVALGVQVATAAGTTLVAPAAATVIEAAPDAVTLAVEGFGLIDLYGVDPLVAQGAAVTAGEVVATVASEGDVGVVWVQRRAVGAVRAPRLVVPGRESAWAALCPDPSPLLGIAALSAPAAPADALVTRAAHLADVQEHYYAAPPRIERGWRHHLFDVGGRGYLDMINNVALVGHGEPRIADAVDAQLRRLNTNSRFHYGAIADFAAELAARAPEGLDTVFLVNSGSEAVDLALRIVRAATGRADILALTEAYHGWTLGADAVSTSLGDNPAALGTRPEWVHLLDAPNTYRGTHRGADAHRYLDDALAALAALDTQGVELAGFIAEPLFGNGGGIALPAGYLAGVWEAVRARGGLVISDEVQVGYGRLGEHFWGFEEQRAVPDVIAVAKGMGNGHPLGAVITTRAIAEAFGVEGSFFSSAGGSPVSCVVGSTVLRILDEDGLQDNARVVGALLREGLVVAGRRHPALGAVHGMGLYLGVEVVAGGPDLPDAAGAREICDAMLDEGVIVQPTGDHKNVLKIKPPLTIDAAAVQRFLDALDRVMTLRESRAAL